MKKQKLFLFTILAATFIPVLVFVMQIASTTYQREISNAYSTLEITNKSRVVAIESFLSPVVDICNMLTENYNVKNAQNPYCQVLIKDELNKLTNSFHGISMIYLGLENGKFFSSMNFELKEIPSSRPWYKEALKDPDKVIITKPYKDLFSGKNLIAVVKTVRDYNTKKIIGVVGIDISADYILDNFSKTGNLKTAYSYILDTKGLTIIHNDNTKVGRNINDNILLKKSVNKSGYFEYTLNSVEKLAFYQKLNFNDWILYTAINKEDIMKEPNAILLKLIIISFIFLFIAVITETAFSKFIRQTSINEQVQAANEELRALNEELEDSYNNIEELSGKFETLVNATSDTLKNIGTSKKEYFNYLLETLFQIVPEADYGTITMIRNNKIKIVAAKGHDIERLNSLNLDKKHLKITEEPKIIDITDNTEMLPEILKNKLAHASKPIKSTMYCTIFFEKEPLGNIALDIEQSNPMNFSKESMKVLKTLTNLASAFLSYNKYFEIKEKMQEDIIYTIIGILELYDSYTEGHSKNVANVSVKLAKAMGIKGNELEKVYMAGLVHDIGKILIPQSILNKPSRLSEDEFHEIKKHPEHGYSLLKKHKELKDIAKYILYHHERYDGSGYPEGLKGNEIPLISRIITVADCYDAMISKRSYKDEMSEIEAKTEIFINSGKQFDPLIVEHFMKIDIIKPFEHEKLVYHLETEEHNLNSVK